MTSEPGLSILILEDEVMIAVDMETFLRDAGFAVAGSFSSSSTASEWLAMSNPGLAVLDVRLRDGLCHQVACELRSRGVPIIVYSGMSYDAAADASVFADVPWISKPSSPDELIACITAAFAAKPSLDLAGVSGRLRPETGTGKLIEEASKPKRRVQLTKAQKREQMEIATRAAFDDAERRRAYNALKTERLRALRLASVEHSDCGQCP